MGNDIDNTLNLQNTITNNYLQQLEQTCSADCVAVNSGNTVIVSGNVSGDIVISSECSSNAACSMSNTAYLTATNVIDNLLNQQIKSVTDFMNDLSFNDLDNKTNAYNALVNQITQISSQTCSSTASSTVSNDLVYVKAGGVVGGSILLLSTANANASCTMSNLVKMDTYNQEQTKSDQGTKSIGMFALFGMVLLIITVVCVVIFVLVFATPIVAKAGKAVGSSVGSSSTQSQKAQQTSDSGISSDTLTTLLLASELSKPQTSSPAVTPPVTSTSTV